MFINDLLLNEKKIPWRKRYSFFFSLRKSEADLENSDGAKSR